MKTWYRNLVVGIILIPIVILTIIGFVSNKSGAEQPTTKEYNLLKEYCVQIASGTPREDIQKEGVQVAKEITQDSIEVEIHGNNCSVTATFPLSEENIRIEDGKLHKDRTIQYDKVSYYEEPVSKTNFLKYCLIGSFAWMGIVITILVLIPKEYKAVHEKENKANS